MKFKHLDKYALWGVSMLVSKESIHNFLENAERLGVLDIRLANGLDGEVNDTVALDFALPSAPPASADAIENLLGAALMLLMRAFRTRPVSVDVTISDDIVTVTVEHTDDEDEEDEDDDEDDDEEIDIGA